MWRGLVIASSERVKAFSLRFVNERSFDLGLGFVEKGYGLLYGAATGEKMHTYPTTGRDELVAV